MRDHCKLVASMFGWNVFATSTLTICIGCSTGMTRTGPDVDFEGIRETDQGFEAVATVSIDTTQSATRMAFVLLEIEQIRIDAEDSGKRDIEGRSEERDAVVTVVLEARGVGSTHVQVRAQRGRSDEAEDYEGDVNASAPPAGRTATDPTLTLRRRIELWDKDLARQVIEKIVEFTGLKGKTSEN